MKKFGITLIGLILASTSLSKADTIHVVVREYVLKENGGKEPEWRIHGKACEWHKPSEGIVEKYNLPRFPVIEDRLTFSKDLKFSATKTGRGRIVIDVFSGEKNLAHTQDDLFGDSCALACNYSGQTKIEISVWTTKM